jgi:hypothetical protein
MRDRVFATIVAASFAANFTIGALYRALDLFGTSASGDAYWQDAQAWVLLAIPTMLALLLWVAAARMWRRSDSATAHG